jgi:hypothetical protein
MNNKLTKIVKTIGLRVRTNVLEAPHPTLVAYGISVVIVTGLAVGFAALSDPSHMAHAMKRIE